MRKIPTLFLRDYNAARPALVDQVTPGCEWVLAGEGTATRKYDGTCVLIRRDGMAAHAFARREVKPGKRTPPGFVLVEHDQATGKMVGWEPIEQSPFRAMFAEAVEPVEQFGALIGAAPPAGTYELVGPKINGNPERAQRHRLESHANAEQWDSRDVLPSGLTGAAAFEHLRSFVLALSVHEGWEGIVWHHPDGRMVKLKARDFR